MARGEPLDPSRRQEVLDLAAEVGAAEAARRLGMSANTVRSLQARHRRAGHAAVVATASAPIVDRRATTATCGAFGKSGTPCDQPAGKGTDHVGSGRCWLHLGNTPTVRRQAFRAAALDAAHLRLGRGLDIDPNEAMLALVAEAAANVVFYRSFVEELDQGDLYESTFHANGSPTGEAKRHILVQLYDTERDRLAAYCKQAHAMGIAERQVEIAERQAEMVAQVILAVVSDPALALDVDRQQLARRLAAAELRRVAIEADVIATTVAG